MSGEEIFYVVILMLIIIALCLLYIGVKIPIPSLLFVVMGIAIVLVIFLIWAPSNLSNNSPEESINEYYQKINQDDYAGALNNTIYKYSNNPIQKTQDIKSYFIHDKEQEIIFEITIGDVIYKDNMSKAQKEFFKVQINFIEENLKKNVKDYCIVKYTEICSYEGPPISSDYQVAYVKIGFNWYLNSAYPLTSN